LGARQVGHLSLELGQGPALAGYPLPQGPDEFFRFPFRDATDELT
jgi:hypothetical protein